MRDSMELFIYLVVIIISIMVGVFIKSIWLDVKIRNDFEKYSACYLDIGAYRYEVKIMEEKKK